VRSGNRRVMTSSAPDWDALQAAIEGAVVLPSSPDYESIRKLVIATFHDVRPRAVVSCETPADVSKTISVARRSGLPTATRSGGHCFAGRSSSQGVVIDVRPMRSVSVSGDVATAGAGARLGEVYDALDEHGLTIPAGCGPSVGICDVRTVCVERSSPWLS
jgi:FAD/FMN-containing dehydrogenase